MGFPAKNRKVTIQTIDIHEFKDGDYPNLAQRGLADGAHQWARSRK